MARVAPGEGLVSRTFHLTDKSVEILKDASGEGGIKESMIVSELIEQSSGLIYDILSKRLAERSEHYRKLASDNGK